MHGAASVRRRAVNPEIQEHIVTMHTASQTFAPNRRLFSPRALFSRIVDRIRSRQHMYRTLRQLRGLSDPELSDIGITRCEIDRVARSNTDWRQRM